MKLVLARNHHEFVCFVNNEYNGYLLYRSGQIKFVSSLDSFRGLSNASLVILDGAKYNSEYTDELCNYLLFCIDGLSKIVLIMFVLDKTEKN
jgi:hypothetical protein